MSLSENTVKLYNFYLKKYIKSDFSDVAKTIETIKNSKNRFGEPMSESAQKIIISAIMWKLSKQGNSEILINKYRKEIKEVLKITNETDRDNDVYSGHIPDWNDIIKIRDAQQPYSRDHLILALYTYIPPRRETDYVFLKIANREDDMDDTSFNYYDTRNQVFVFNVYKTVKVYKKQRIDTPDELINIIEKYIDVHVLKSGDLLLNFKDRFQLLYRLKKLLGCGIDNIRHSFVNNEFKTMPNSRTLEYNAYAMGHSLMQHLRYRKNIKDS